MFEEDFKGYLTSVEMQQIYELASVEIKQL